MKEKDIEKILSNRNDNIDYAKRLYNEDDSVVNEMVVLSVYKKLMRDGKNSKKAVSATIDIMKNVEIKVLYK